MRFDFWCHISFCTCDCWKLRNDRACMSSLPALRWIVVLGFCLGWWMWFLNILSIKHPGEPKITYFCSKLSLFLVYEDILRLQITMQDIIFVYFDHAIDHLREDLIIILPVYHSSWATAPIDEAISFIFIIAFFELIFQTLAGAILHLYHHIDRLVLLPLR